jgi:hypothetical protein
MLLQHVSDVPHDVGATAFPQDRPDLRVLELVVAVQGGGHEDDMAGNGLRAHPTTVSGGPDQPGHEQELAPKHPVQHVHFARVEELPSASHP